MIYLCNSFSLQMLNMEKMNIVEITPLELEKVKKILSKGFISVVGHKDTAVVLSNVLGFNIPFNRISINLTTEDMLIVAQLTNGRLPEGSTTLPEGAKFKFFKVNIIW